MQKIGVPSIIFLKDKLRKLKNNIIVHWFKEEQSLKKKKRICGTKIILRFNPRLD